MNRKKNTGIILSILVFLSCSVAPPRQFSPGGNISRPWTKVSGLPDLSGVEWISGNKFLAVHDAKYPSEKDRPRISILQIKDDKNEISWLPLEISWPEKMDAASDLESIARIPGTRSFLLCESGNSGGKHTRIFVSVLDEDDRVIIKEVVNWPVKIYNVESSAVIRLKEEYYFVFAERAADKNFTELKWAKLDLNPLRFGKFSSIQYSAGIRGKGYRPIVSLTASSDGELYAVAAYDPNRDDGPFRSYVSHLGKFRISNSGNLEFIPLNQFAKILEQDGNKIEGLTLVEKKNGSQELFAGTDDEDLGAAFRRVR